MLKEKIRKFLTGVRIAKEYPCVDHRQFNNEVKVLMHYKGKEIDITADHLFLGYKPLIAGIYFPYDLETGELSISFFYRDNTRLADLRLKKFRSIPLDHHYLVLFTGMHASTFFLPFFYRKVNTLLRRFRKRINGNVEMEGNEYQQVQGMYSIPRKISVISLGKNQLYNMFPTDLHGSAGKYFYVDSLRKAGKACQQVLDLKKIIKADVELSAMDGVFAMGKNHMRELQEISSFPVDGLSDQYHLPLPKSALAYKELELHDHIEIGIHRILIFRVVNEVELGLDKPILSCTNSHYLQWRVDHFLPANYV